jgi:hypothetical protein
MLGIEPTTVSVPVIWPGRRRVFIKLITQKRMIVGLPREDWTSRWPTFVFPKKTLTPEIWGTVAILLAQKPLYHEGVGSPCADISINISIRGYSEWCRTRTYNFLGVNETFYHWTNHPKKKRIHLRSPFTDSIFPISCGTRHPHLCRRWEGTAL